MITPEPAQPDDLIAADWLVAEIQGFSGRVRDLVPASYDAFVRIPAGEGTATIDALTQVLREHTHTVRCWYGLWEGWPAADVWTGAQTFHLPHRGYRLLKGQMSDDLQSVSGDDRGPSLWWTGDRSWLVANEVDADATYLGGSSRLIEDALLLTGTSVTEVSPDDPITTDDE